MATPVEAARVTQGMEAKVVVSPAAAAAAAAAEEEEEEEEAEATREASITRATIWMLTAMTVTR